jgi:hypothetical protein
MKTKSLRKAPRKERAFRGLTPAEINQIAQWLQSGTYETVRQRVALPRPEGFGLAVSVSPLQRLRDQATSAALQKQLAARAQAEKARDPLPANSPRRQVATSPRLSASLSDYGQL